jgi:type III restriction enzyme
VNEDGDISNYYPDFLVKLPDNKMVVVETKGREDLDVPQKMRRLRQWCEDVNGVSPATQYDFVYVDEESFEMYQPKTFTALMKGFQEYRK